MSSVSWSLFHVLEVSLSCILQRTSWDYIAFISSEVL